MQQVAKYRKKPVVIEAVQFDGENLDAISAFTDNQFQDVESEDRTDDPDIVAEAWDKLHSTWFGVKADQWTIRGVQGEFYPCDAEVFAATYDAA